MDHDILLSKLEHYGIKGVTLNWLRSYLTQRPQFLLNDYGVPQGSVLGPLLLLIYINDLNNEVKDSYIHYFADDTNLLYSSNSLKLFTKTINYDLKNLAHWLKANKISLHTKN